MLPYSWEALLSIRVPLRVPLGNTSTPVLRCAVSSLLRYCAFHVHLVKHTVGQPPSTDRELSWTSLQRSPSTALKVSEIKAWQQASFEMRASCICLTLCARLDGSVFSCSWCVVQNEEIHMCWKYTIFFNYVKLLICFFTETSCFPSQSSETWCIRYYKG